MVLQQIFLQPYTSFGRNRWPTQAASFKTRSTCIRTCTVSYAWLRSAGMRQLKKIVTIFRTWTKKGILRAPSSLHLPQKMSNARTWKIHEGTYGNSAPAFIHFYLTLLSLYKRCLKIGICIKLTLTAWLRKHKYDHPSFPSLHCGRFALPRRSIYTT